MLGASLGISTSDVAEAAGKSNSSSHGNGNGMNRSVSPPAKPVVTQNKAKAADKAYQKMDEYIRQ
jgi:hypothetical protein